MRRRVNLIYLTLVAVTISLLSMEPEKYIIVHQLVWIIASITYPFFLERTNPGIRFWKGPIYFFMILAEAQICGFVTYLVWYGVWQYQRLASASVAVDLAIQNINESAAFFIALDLVPSFVVSAVCYLLGYIGTRLLIRLRTVKQ
jgi:hypothetical protein